MQLESASFPSQLRQSISVRNGAASVGTVPPKVPRPFKNSLTVATEHHHNMLVLMFSDVAMHTNRMIDYYM